MTRSSRPYRICLIFSALALAGCGRAGPLEPPPGAPPAQPASVADTGTAAPSNYNPAAPEQSQPTGTNANPQPKGQSFFLDPLVK